MSKNRGHPRRLRASKIATSAPHDTLLLGMLDSRLSSPSCVAFFVVVAYPFAMAVLLGRGKDNEWGGEVATHPGFR